MRDVGAGDLRIREVTSLTADDAAAVTRLHAEVYGAEQGWDARFTEYVEHTLEVAAAAWEPGRDRLWLALLDGVVVGSIAMVHAADGRAQLRWLVVRPEARGRGIGQRLVTAAVQFARDCGYGSIFLLTTATLEAAAHLYRQAGFALVEEHVVDVWGAHVAEQRYELNLEPGHATG